MIPTIEDPKQHGKNADSGIDVNEETYYDHVNSFSDKDAQVFSDMKELLYKIPKKIKVIVHDEGAPSKVFSIDKRTFSLYLIIMPLLVFFLLIVILFLIGTIGHFPHAFVSGQTNTPSQTTTSQATPKISTATTSQWDLFSTLTAVPEQTAGIVFTDPSVEKKNRDTILKTAVTGSFPSEKILVMGVVEGPTFLSATPLKEITLTKDASTPLEIRFDLPEKNKESVKFSYQIFLFSLDGTPLSRKNFGPL